MTSTPAPATQPRRHPTRAWALAAVTGLTIALAGCSSTAPQPLDLGPNVVQLPVRQAWQARVPALNDLSVRLATVDENILISTADGTILSLHAATGRENWRTHTGQPLQTGIGSDGRHTAVVTQDNTLTVLDNGQPAWRHRLTAAAYTAPLVAGGRIFVMTGDRTISAYDAQDGLPLWTHRRDSEPLVLRQQGVLMPYGNLLLAGLSGRLVALNPDNGTILWETALATPRGTNDVERLVDLVGPASRTPGSPTICARAFQASVGCVDTARARTLWTQSAKGMVGLASDGQTVFGTESNGTVIAWIQRDGTRQWKHDRLQHRRLTAPLVLGRSIVIGDHLGQVHLLARDNGTPLNRLTTDDSGIATTPVAAANTLIVITRSGGIYGFQPD